MDSVTQALLGGAIGEAVLGRRAGRRAAAWGAVLGTLPDLDLLIPRGGPVADFTFHRAETHSLFYLTLAAPLIAWVLWRLYRGVGVPAGAPPGTAPADFRAWWLMCWLALVTHPLLDVLTVYGTQLGLPFTDHPYGTGSVFVVDPAYTLPVLAGLLCALLLRRDRPLGRRLNFAGLALGTAYLAFGLLAQAHVTGIARAELARQGLAHDRLLVAPTPLNGALWRVLAMQPTGYCEAFRSLLEGDTPLVAECHPSEPALLEPIADAWAVRRLQWFTHGYFSVAREGDEIVLRDLRMGQEPDYVFAFAVGRVRDGRIEPLVPEVQLEFAGPTARSLGWIRERVLAPEAGTYLEWRRAQAPH